MSNSFFKFKQFTVHQELTAMKVGTDGVLLGAWAPIINANSILDVGTGTGLIALMLAQRCRACIDAIDISTEAIQQANFNVSASPWADRIHLFKNSFQDYASSTGSQYDLIVSNPPYFENSLHSPDGLRNLARHAVSLGYIEFITHAIPLLRPLGRICLILPTAEGLRCVEHAQSIGLYCTQLVSVMPKPNVEAKRILIEFSLENLPLVESELLIETIQRHEYSPEFTKLVKDFYLKL